MRHEDIVRALLYRRDHPGLVESLMQGAETFRPDPDGVEPSGEDARDPRLMSGAHWIWFHRQFGLGRARRRPSWASALARIFPIRDWRVVGVDYIQYENAPTETLVRRVCMLTGRARADIIQGRWSAYELEGGRR